MDKIVHITNTGIRITPWKKGQTCLYLENCNCMYDPVYHRKIPVTGFQKKRTYYTYRFNLEKLQVMLPDYRFEPDLPVYIWEAHPFHFNQDIEFNVLQEKAISEAKSTGTPRVFINLQTGRGKTFVGIELISQAHCKALIMCYSSAVLSQWAESFTSHTDIDPKRIIYIRGYGTLDKILEGKIKVEDYDIFLMTPSLCLSYAKRYSWEQLGEVVSAMHIGVKIYDEAHRNISTMVMLDANTNIDKTYYLSADFNQSNLEKAQKYFSMFWDVPIINPENEVEIDLNYVVVTCVDYNSHPEDRDQVAVVTKRGFNNFNYMRYQFEKGVIFQVIDTVVEQTLPFLNGFRVLILTSLIEHIPLIVNHLKSLYGNQYKIGGYHGEMEKENKQNTIDHAQIIVATYSSFSVGVDVKGIQFVLSLDQIDPITDNQSAGRARPIEGRKAFYFLCSDFGFERCIKSRKKRISYLKTTKASGFYNVWIGDK